MDDQEFLDKIKAKIERLSGVEIQLSIDADDENLIRVEFERSVPEVTLGSNALQYSGFARMAIEYAVACLRSKRDIGPLEFNILLARN